MRLLWKELSLHSTLIPHSPKVAAALAATDENSLGVNFFMGFLKLSVFLQIDDSIHPPFLAYLASWAEGLLTIPDAWRRERDLKFSTFLCMLKHQPCEKCFNSAQKLVSVLLDLLLTAVKKMIILLKSWEKRLNSVLQQSNNILVQIHIFHQLH